MPIHKHGVLSQLLHVDEVWAVVKMLAAREGVSSLGPGASASEAWCEEKLVQVRGCSARGDEGERADFLRLTPACAVPSAPACCCCCCCCCCLVTRLDRRVCPCPTAPFPRRCVLPSPGAAQVSRSFAMVIRQLPAGLRSAICNFYLALRGLVRVCQRVVVVRPLVRALAGPDWAVCGQVVCVCGLLCAVQDTVEDDMTSFPDVSVKIGHLKRFHTYLRDPSWSLHGVFLRAVGGWAACQDGGRISLPPLSPPPPLPFPTVFAPLAPPQPAASVRGAWERAPCPTPSPARSLALPDLGSPPRVRTCVSVCALSPGIGEGAERELLESFGHVANVFGTLPPQQRDVIADITARMGDGMALYIARNLRQGTVDLADYNLYCHFVAGLVGEGLSGIFSAAGYEGTCPPFPTAPPPAPPLAADHVLVCFIFVAQLQFSTAWRK